MGTDMSVHDIFLRRARTSDSEFLFRCRTDPETVRQSNGHAPTRSEHLLWLAESLRNDGRCLFIAEQAGAAIGTGRMDRHGNKVELSWCLAPEHRGKGYSLPLILALHAASRLSWPGARILARIRSDNTPSLKAALAAGMRPTNTTLLDLEAS